MQGVPGRPGSRQLKEGADVKIRGLGILCLHGSQYRLWHEGQAKVIRGLLGRLWSQQLERNVGGVAVVDGVDVEIRG